ESFPRRRGQKARRNDLVRVDVGHRQDRRTRAQDFDRFHELAAQPFISSRGSVIRPRTAQAAAVSGLASNVRAPTPWRPSKLRLLVLTEYWPLPTRSPFIPRHMEQPDSRHSAPASMKTLSRPSASASCLTCWEPGTTSICTPLATLLPRRMLAALRRSDSRPLVQLPTNTTFTTWSLMGSPASNPM